MKLSSSPRLQRGLLALWDALSWAVAISLVVGGRYDFDLNSVLWSDVAVFLAVAITLQWVVGFASGLYQGRYRPASFEEAARLGVTVLVIWIVLSVLFLGALPFEPRGLVALTPLPALVLMGLGRFILRFLSTRSVATSSDDAEPVLIYGAGNAGTQLARLIDQDPEAPYEVLGFVDDDPAKRKLQISSHRVLGTKSDITRLASDLGASAVIIAIPSADAEFLRQTVDPLEAAGLKVLVLPSVSELVQGRTLTSQIHKVDVADLLGRSQVRIDVSQVANYLEDKVVLVTGAGGSIGSEIARQLHAYGLKELVLLDRDESGLHGTQLSIYGKGLLDTPDMVLCDIRDREALDRVFQAHQPDIVFHAAALKHLPMLEQYPSEAWKSNVLGTWNVLDAAQRHGVQHFVNISTDKAADPTSVLGTSKRLAERLTSWYSLQCEGTWLSVRFGNVLGSRGSMLHTFTQQIENDQPVTVTHPDITRYFMTIPEAARLTLQAGAIGKPGDVLVLDMGEPVRIMDVAKRLIRYSGKDIPIQITGLRPGEKLHEVLFSAHEDAAVTSHPKIRRVGVPSLAPDELDQTLFLQSAKAPAPQEDLILDTSKDIVAP